MKIVARIGAFETNSSSAHSLVVSRSAGPYTKEELADGLYLSADGTWRIWSEDSLSFERAPFDVLATFAEKARYLIAERCGHLPQEEAAREFSRIEGLVRDIDPDIKEIVLPHEWLPRDFDEEGAPLSYADVTGYDDQDRPLYIDDEGHQHTGYSDEIDATCYGDVDHASAGLLSDFLEKRGVSERDFLTRREYVVIVDGDEYMVWDKLKESGLVDEAAIAYDSSAEHDVASREEREWREDAGEADVPEGAEDGGLEP